MHFMPITAAVSALDKSNITALLCWHTLTKLPVTTALPAHTELITHFVHTVQKGYYSACTSSQVTWLAGMQGMHNRHA
jgi:hypothetical protein